MTPNRRAPELHPWEIPLEERCQAVLKSTWRWRCGRRATVGVLCGQHALHGARVPERWEHERNSHDVLICDPIGPYHLEGGKS